MPTIYVTISPQILCFSPRDGHNNYVKIYKGSGCSSQVGMNGGEQGISLVGTVGTAGCWHQHPIVHEFIHAFGFYHEHMRPDRDDYVEIIWKNIPEGLWYLFDKITGSETFGVEYDGRSVMHYTSNAFTNNSFGDGNTIKSKVKIQFFKLTNMYCHAMGYCNNSLSAET